MNDPAGDSVITFVGDVMPARKVAVSLRRIGLDAAAARLRELLPAGPVVANLECPLCSSRRDMPPKPDGGPRLRGEPHMAAWLRSAGLSAVSLANNHSMDCGPDGLIETLDALGAAGVRTVGAGRDIAQATRPLVLQAGSSRVAVLAFGNGPPARPRRPGVAPFRSSVLIEAIGRVPDGVDAVIVMMHCGLEFLEYPESWTRQFAQEALWGGADVVIGGHSHCLRGIVERDGKLIAYGLGDFVMDTADPQHLSEHVKRTALTRLGFGVADPSICREGLIVSLKIEPGRVTHEVQPILVGEDFLPARPEPRRQQALIEKLNRLSDAVSTGSGPEIRRLADIERAYRRAYGTGRSLRDWLTLPLRIGPYHLRRLWRSIVR